MRQIVLDTETTGLEVKDGHRIIEIGCIEMVDRKISGRHFHVFVNPMREIDEGAFQVHGISNEFLEDKPLFSDILQEFLEFITDAEVIIHNASFDTAFLNAEFIKAGLKKPLEDYCVVTDTLKLAREKYPGQRNSLDALCKRLNVDNAHRKLHGALLDAEILAYVYLELTGGQKSFLDELTETAVEPITAEAMEELHIPQYAFKVILPTDEELEMHQAFLDYLVKE